VAEQADHHDPGDQAEQDDGQEQALFEGVDPADRVIIRGLARVQPDMLVDPVAGEIKPAADENTAGRTCAVPAMTDMATRAPGISRPRKTARKPCRAMRSVQERKRDQLLELQAKVPDMPPGPRMTLELGISITERIIEWCESAERRLAEEQSHALEPRNIPA